jgi:hypothetical protein
MLHERSRSLSGGHTSPSEATYYLALPFMAADQGIAAGEAIEGRFSRKSGYGGTGPAAPKVDPCVARLGASAYDARSSFSFASMKSTSAGLVPGPPAKWPQIDETGTSLAFGMCATSNSLSSGGKYRSVWPGIT